MAPYNATLQRIGENVQMSQTGIAWAWVTSLGVFATVSPFTEACTKRTQDNVPPPSMSAAATTLAGTLATGDTTDSESPKELMAPPAGAQETASGLRLVVLHAGAGSEHPAESDRVRVHFTGWTKDGTMFDSSALRAPGLFTLTQIIPGWTEALKLMVPGERRKLWIPARLAYGENPPYGAPAGDLIFDVELVEIIHSPKVPEDVMAAPKAAKVTATGLAYRVLQAGPGRVHPRPTDTITVKYSGWTPDGLLFDSASLRDGPVQFTVGSLIKGWTEGAGLMVMGDRTRFWMPADLAYGDHPTDPDKPAGMLVFDIELLDIR